MLPLKRSQTSPEVRLRGAGSSGVPSVSSEMYVLPRSLSVPSKACRSSLNFFAIGWIVSTRCALVALIEELNWMRWF